MPVSKEEAHLFEELNVVDVGIVADEGIDTSHISSPGRFLHKTVQDEIVSDSDISDIEGTTHVPDEVLTQYPLILFDLDKPEDLWDELDQWFVMNDLKHLDLLKSENLDNDLDALKVLSIQLETQLSHQDHIAMIRTLQLLNNFAMGQFKDKQAIYKNVILMIENNQTIPLVIKVLKYCLDLLIQFQPHTLKLNLGQLSLLNYYSSTILYFAIVIALEKDLPLNSQIDESNILEKLIHVVDHWRWLSNDPASIQSHVKQCFKLRNIILLISKLITLQLGGPQLMKTAKKFVKIRNNGSLNHPEFSVSPLDYFHYQEELQMKYPAYTPPQPEISKQIQSTIKITGNTKTMLESLINEPFSQRRAPATPTQQAPEIHIATPAPSPSLTPITPPSPVNNERLSNSNSNNNNNAKKFFQSTSSFPYLYPTSPDPTSDVPFSIKEATEVFYNSINEDINTKQFMQVYEHFIVQERGVLDTISSLDDSFRYNEQDLEKYPEYVKEIRALMRVEELYRSCLSYFNSLVKVLLQVVESSISKESRKHNQSRERELTREEMMKLMYETDSTELNHLLKQKFEIDRVREISNKLSLRILNDLLKWFKISHLLKFEFFSMIIFDSNYYQTSLDFISKNMEESQCHLNNHNEFMLENLNLEDDELLKLKFNNDKLAFIKYQYYSEFNFNRCIKDQFVIDDYRFSSRFGVKENDQFLKFSDQIESIKEIQENGQLQQFYGTNGIECRIYNKKYCETLTYLLNIMHLTMFNNKTQRINQLIEKKPTELLKFCLQFHNKSFYAPILKIIKLIIPFNGRKWKSNNMDAISMIYLYSKIKLKDEWLTKNYNNTNLDINEELKKSYKQEYSLRSLLQYYNIKYYDGQMNQMGFEYFEMDYFNKELEMLSRMYLNQNE